MFIFGIVLCKPIPGDGRKPTARGFRRLRTNVLPTTSGSWRLAWIDCSGIRKPYLLYRGRNTSRASDGSGWTFEILAPEQKTSNEPITPPIKPVVPLSNHDAGHAEPTMCW